MNEEFRDDGKDAGELGAGHSLTAVRDHASRRTFEVYWPWGHDSRPLMRLDPGWQEFVTVVKRATY